MNKKIIVSILNQLEGGYHLEPLEIKKGIEELEKVLALLKKRDSEVINN